MNVYRITFHTTKFLQHFDATADKATHYHIMRNNKKIGERSKLWQALKLIKDDTGGNNPELSQAIENDFVIRKYPDSNFECVGITFNEKHGIKIEMKLLIIPF